MTPATSLATFEVLADLLPDGLMILGSDGVIVAANDQLAELFGCSVAEIVGSELERFVPAEHRAAHVAHRDSFFDSGGARAMGVGLDLWARRTDGTEFPVDVSLRHVEIDGTDAVVAAIRDLTAQREAERIRASLEVVRGATRSAVIVLEATGIIGGVNDAATRLLGVDADQIVGRPLEATVLGETDRLVQTRDECLAGRHVEERPMELATAWGVPVPVSLTARPVHGGRGETVAVSMLLFDRSEQEASQLALQSLQARLEVTERLGGIGSWEYNASTEELQLSPGLLALLDLDPFAATGTLADLTTVMDETQADTFLAALERSASTGEAISIEGEATRTDGVLRWITIEGSSAPSAEGAATAGCAGIVQDVTESHEAMASLRRGRSAEGRVPLDRLPRAAYPADRHRRVRRSPPLAGRRADGVYLEAVHRNASEMDLMVDQLLDMSRVQSGRVQLSPEPRDLHELIDDVVGYVAHAVREHGVDNATSPVQVMADDLGFRRIVANLLSNAAKFSPAGSRIVISDEVDHVAGLTTVTVTDPGIGIDASDAESVFDLFVQARAGRPADVPGTGVGLDHRASLRRDARGTGVGRERAGRRRRVSASPSRLADDASGEDGAA